MDRGPATRVGSRTRPHHHLRRPRIRHRGAAALPGRRGRGPDRDQRRPGADRRRYDRRDRGAVLRTRTGAGHRARGQDRGDLEKVDGAPGGGGLRGGTRRQPQAGHGAGRRAGERPVRRRRGGVREALDDDWRSRCGCGHRHRKRGHQCAERCQTSATRPSYADHMAKYFDVPTSVVPVVVSVCCVEVPLPHANTDCHGDGNCSSA